MKLVIKNRGVVKQGKSHFFYIPRAYFLNGQLDIEEKYDIVVKEVDK